MFIVKMLLKIIPISISTFVLKPDVLIELPQGGEKKLSKADFSNCFKQKIWEKSKYKALL